MITGRGSHILRGASCIPVVILLLLSGLATPALAADPATAQTEDLRYTFRPGDSLWSVCEQFAQDPNRCWQDLAGYNNIDSPRSIPPGAELRIPASWLKLKPRAARVLVSTGNLLIYRKDVGAPEPARAGSELQLGDALETGPDGYAKVEFADGSWLLIQPSSLVVFNRFSQYRESGMVDTEVRLEHGDLRSWVRPRGEGGFIIVTPTAMAAVRGTEFHVSHDADDVMRAEVRDGVVMVSAEGVVVPVEAGQATLALPGEPPQPARAMLPAPIVKVGGGPGLRASWTAVASATRYQVEVFTAAGKPLWSDYTEALSIRRDLADGNYVLVVRAVDEDGLRGREARHAVTLAKPVPAPVVAEPAPEPEKKERPAWLGAVLFVVGTAIVLGL